MILRSLALTAFLAGQAWAGLMPAPMSDPLAAPRTAFEAGRYQEVVDRLTPEAMQRLGNKDLARAYLLLGRAYERIGRLDLALGAYQVSTKVFPKDINLLSELGLLLHHAGLEEQAQPVFEKVLAIHPNNSQAHLGLAEIDAALGLLRDSAAHYEKALAVLSSQSALWRDYADVLYRRRSYDAAETAARKALSLSDDADSLIELAFIQRGQSRLADALKTLDGALAKAPARREVALLRSCWLLEADRFEEALPAAQAALAQDPEEALALWIRARVALRRGKTREAAADLEAAAKQSRRSPFAAAAARALLRELRSARP